MKEKKKRGEIDRKTVRSGLCAIKVSAAFPWWILQGVIICSGSHMYDLVHLGGQRRSMHLRCCPAVRHIATINTYHELCVSARLLEKGKTACNPAAPFAPAVLQLLVSLRSSPPPKLHTVCTPPAGCLSWRRGSGATRITSCGWSRCSASWRMTR